MSDAPAPASMNVELLIKLLNMTTASEDTVALVAMRKANAHLQEKLGSTWEALLHGKVTVVADPFASVAPPPTTAKRAPPNAPAPPRPAPPTFSSPPPRPQAPPRPASPPPTAARPTIVPHFRNHSGAWTIYTDQSATFKAGLNLSVRRRDGSTVDVTLFSELKRDADGIYWTFHDNAPPPVDPNLSKWQNRQKARAKLDDIA